MVAVTRVPKLIDEVQDARIEAARAALEQLLAIFPLTAFATAEHQQVIHNARAVVADLGGSLTGRFDAVNALWIARQGER